MTPDAMERLAHQRAVDVSIELETQLDRGPTFTPMKAILGKARSEAQTAMVGLVVADPADIEKVRGLQNEIRRYDDLVRWCAEIIEQGRAAEVWFRAEDADEFAEIFATDEGRQQATALGIQTQDNDA